MSARYASFQSQISLAINEATNPDCGFEGKLKVLAVQTRVLLFFLAKVIELTYGAKSLNFPNLLVHREISKTVETSIGEL